MFRWIGWSVHHWYRSFPAYRSAHSIMHSRTWHRWEGLEKMLHSWAEIHYVRTLFLTHFGALIVQVHHFGESLIVTKVFGKAHWGPIWNIAEASNQVVICSLDKTAKFCEVLSFETNATLSHDNEVACAAVDERKVITACDNVGLIYVFRNAPPYPLPTSIINNDVILVARQKYVTFNSCARQISEVYTVLFGNSGRWSKCCWWWVAGADNACNYDG